MFTVIFEVKYKLWYNSLYTLSRNTQIIVDFPKFLMEMSTDMNVTPLLSCGGINVTGIPLRTRKVAVEIPC
jgi:hypothetical protein